MCYGTKNAERCFCEGDTEKCDFYEHVRKGNNIDCLDVLNVVTTCNGEHRKSMDMEPATTGSAANAEIGSKTTLPTKQKERTPMRDKRFVLNLYLEQNEELIAEIDSLIRERVKMIVREEAEKMIGGTINEEAQRVVQAKLENMKSYDMSNAIRDGIRRFIVWDSKVESLFLDQIRSYLKDRDHAINNIIREYVSNKLSNIVPVDIVTAVTDALTKR